MKLQGRKSLSDEPISSIPSEPIIISGVVHPHGSSGFRVGKTEDWTLQFAFETWRGKDGILNPNKLAIRRIVTKDELNLYVNQIRPYEVLSAQVIFTGPES